MLPLLPLGCSFGGPPDDEPLVHGAAVDLAATDGETESIVALRERSAEDRGRHGLGPDRLRPGNVLLVDLGSGRRGPWLRANPLAQKPTKWILVLPIGGRLAGDRRGKRVERPGGCIGHGSSDRPGENATGLPCQDGRQPRGLGRAIARLAPLSTEE